MSKHPLIAHYERAQMKSTIPTFRVGDTLTVQIRILEAARMKDGPKTGVKSGKKEEAKERLQAFTGTVIARDGEGLSETVTLHRVAYGEGMQRVFYLHSPLIAGIELVRHGDVRRSKLYYLLGTSGRASKVKSRYVPAGGSAKEAASGEEAVMAMAGAADAISV